MTWYQKRVKKLHEAGMACINVYKPFEVPEDYKQYLGIVTDSALQDISYERKWNENTRRWEMTGPNAYVETKDIDKVIEIAGGSKCIQSFLLQQIAWKGADNLRSMTTDDFNDEDGIGLKKMDALVQFGVRDTRKPKEPTPIHIDGTFIGEIDGVHIEGRISGVYKAKNRL